MTEQRRQTIPTFPDVAPNQAISTVSARAYQRKLYVHWGYMHRHTEEFTDIHAAIAFYGDHDGGPSGARITGDGYDADHDGDGFHEKSDGLTEAERDLIEEFDAKRGRK